MDREYLEDYEQREREEYDRFFGKTIEAGKFDFQKDRYPPEERFVKLQKPVAHTSLLPKDITNIWGQIPFCGSLVLRVPPLSNVDFERHFFEISEMSRVIDFIKDTGKLQISLNSWPTTYIGLDYLDPLFTELSPPMPLILSPSILADKEDYEKAENEYIALGSVRFFDYIRKMVAISDSPSMHLPIQNKAHKTYMTLKLAGYTILTEAIENLIIEEPKVAVRLMGICQSFIVDPILGINAQLTNFTLNEIKEAQILPSIHQPKEIRFPCEIGKFLLRKLTYSAQDMRACYYLLDNYDNYDLQKVHESLNQAIVTNHSDIVKKTTKELYVILDNVWNDPTIPKRIENIKIGVPVSIAALGGVAGGIVGGLVAGPEGALIGGSSGVGIGDFLTKLGFKVGEKALEKLFRTKGENVSEQLAKFRTKSHQVNIYDFRKKYKK